MFDSLRQLHWSIYALSLASGVIMTGFMMMLPILPEYTSQLGFNEFEIGLLVAAFFLGRVAFQFPLGALSDRAGRKLIMSGALLLFALATTAFVFTTEPWLMIPLRLGQGISSAGFVVGFQAYVNDLTPKQYRGLAHGINSSAINAGVILGPLVGGLLAQRYSIQTPFLVGGALGFFCFLLSLRVRSIQHQASAQQDGERKAAVERLKDLLRPALTLPVFSLSLIHFLQMMSLAILFAIAPDLTAELLDWDISDVAVALAVGGAAGAISSPFLGRLADREGARTWVMAAGLVVMAFQSLVIYIHPGTAFTLIGFIIGGAGTPAYFNSFFSMIGDVTLRRERGAVSGFIGSTAEWGSVIGSGLLAPLLWRSLGVRSPMAFSFGILLLTAVVVLMARPLLHRRSQLVHKLDT